MGRKFSYRGLTITNYNLPYAKFQWFHPDYDGPEDPRFGTGMTIEECADEIDDLLEGEIDG